jgi:hypothetical protein
MFGLSGVKKASLAGLGGEEAMHFRSVDALPLVGERFRASTKRVSLPSWRKTQEELAPPLNGEVLDFTFLLGNDPTMTQIPLNGLRLRFRGDPVTSSELPGQPRALEKVSDPWFISTNGKEDVVVEGGAWSLEPVSWGRLDNGAGGGKYCLWFWVDLKVPIVKNGIGIQEGRRLFFAINLVERAALPNLFADIQELDAKVASLKEMGRQKATSIGEWIAFVQSYDKRTLYEAQLSTLAKGAPSSSDKLIEFGGFCVRKNEAGVVCLMQGKQFGQVGSFALKAEVGRDHSRPASSTQDEMSI